MKKSILLVFSLVACTTLAWSSGKSDTGKKAESNEIIEVNGVWYELDSKSRTATVTHAGVIDYNRDSVAVVEAGDSLFMYISAYPRGGQAIDGEELHGDAAKKYTGEFILPAMIRYKGKKYRVISIGDEAFWGCTELVSVTIPKGVKRIGRSAFSGCSGLTSLELPADINIIGAGAFSYCTGLLSVTVSGSVTDLGHYAFCCCSRLKDVTIGDGVPGIGMGTFCGCDSLVSVHIGSSVTSIGKAAFFQCPALSSVHLPNSLTKIGEDAFMLCSITSVRIPRNVTSIDKGAFSACDKLSTISVEEGNPVYDSRMGCNAIIETASNTLLAGCRGTIIPNGVTVIAEDAFLGCIGLTSVIVSEGVTHIGKSAFEKCDSLRSVSLPASLTDIGEDAFDECLNLKEVHISNSAAWCQVVFHNKASNPLTFAGHLYMNDAEMMELTIPDSTLRICSYAFSGCYRLFSVTVPNDIETIGQDAFEGVRNIYYSGELAGAPWGAINMNGVRDGVLLYTDESKTRVAACSPAASGTIKVPAEVTEIGDEAFRECTKISVVVIPASVTHIGDSAFAECYSLQSVTIPESVTMMGKCAFDSCTALASVVWNARNCTLRVDEAGNVPPPFRHTSIRQFTFSDKVEAIPPMVCYGLDSLTKLTFPKNVQAVGDEAFRGCTGLTEPIYTPHVFVFLPPAYEGAYAIPKGIKTIAGGAFADCKGLTSVTFPASVDTIGTRAFMNCTSLTSLTVPEGVRSLAYGNNFMNCSSLTEVHWNARSCALAMYKDGDYYAPFFNDTAITTFTFDEHIDDIPAAICAKLTGLTSVFIPNNTKSIGDYAFWGCTNLASVKLPAKTSQVGVLAFYNCPALTEQLYNGFVFAFLPKNYSGAYTIPDNIESIAGGAFAECEGLTAVTIPASVTNIGLSAFRGCTALTEVTIPEGVNTINQGGTFQRCTSLTTVYWNAIHCELVAFTGGSWYPPFYELDNITQFVFGDKVEAIPDGLCCRLRGLTSFTLPQSVTHIGKYAFSHCSGLTTLSIPNTVTSIDVGAFRDCTGLTTVTVPRNVETIGMGATFQGCTALTTVHWNAVNCDIVPLEEGIYYPPFMNLNSITEFTFGGKVETIPASLCWGMGNLTSVTIPAGVTSIGQQAFSGCKSLATIRVNASEPPAIVHNAFEDIAPDAIVYVPEKSFKAYKNADVWKRMNLKLKKKKKK